MQDGTLLFPAEEMQSPFDVMKEMDENGEVQLSTAIRKIRIPSDNCDEQGVLMYNLDAISNQSNNSHQWIC